jgi:DNA polymerase-3 subunit gamma/tau
MPAEDTASARETAAHEAPGASVPPPAGTAGPAPVAAATGPSPTAPEASADDVSAPGPAARSARERPAAQPPTPDRADATPADRPSPDRAAPGPGPERPEPAHGGEPPTPGRADGRPAAQPEQPAALDAATVRRVWSEILAAAKQRSRSTGALMVNATVRAVEGDVLVLTIGSEPLARRLSETRNTDVIADALHAVLGVRWRVRCDHGDAPPAAPRDVARTVAPRTPPPQRPSRPEPSRPAPTRRPAPDDGVPLPPEPPDDEAPPDDEEAMLAEAAPVAHRGPEEVAIELLTAQLGAKAIDRR